MSRIHEALKRAEEEKAERLPDGDALATPGPAAPAIGPSTWPPAMTEVGAKPPDLTSRGQIPADEPLPNTTGGLNFESLAMRCARPDWRPDVEHMLFFAPQDHAKGMEEFRTLRSRLYQIRQKRKLQKVIVTSALPAEGKSFVAANLAQVMVRQHGRRALLIDGDLRHSQLHIALGAPAVPGLTSYLRGEVDEYAIIQRGPLENLFFIPGGEELPNPAELIANGRLRLLLQRVQDAFDWIIVDSPPTVLIADARVMADCCDGVLMVVRSAATPLDMALKVRQEFEGKPLLGVVLNCVEPRAIYGSYYGSYYGAYYGGDGERGGKKRERDS